MAVFEPKETFKRLKTGNPRITRKTQKKQKKQNLICGFFRVICVIRGQAFFFLRSASGHKQTFFLVLDLANKIVSVRLFVPNGIYYNYV